MITALTYTSPTGNSYVIPHNRIQEVEGISKAPYRHSVTKLAGVRGSQYNRSLMDARAIVLEWEIMESSMSDYLLERESIFDAFNPDDGEGTLLIERNFTEYYEIDCVPNDTPSVPDRAAAMTTARAQTRLIANDPAILSQTVVTVSTITAPAGGGFLFDATFDIIFEETSSGSRTLTNNGNIDTYPNMTLVDVLTNPLIRNQTTGAVLQLNYTSALGDVIEIDMKARTIILNGVTSLIDSVVDGTDFWALEQGDNIVTLATGSTSDTGYMNIEYQHAWNSR